MSVLLTHGYFLADDEKEQAIMRPYAPLGILYISAYLEQHGIDNEVFDTTFSTKEKSRNYLQQQRPAIIGIYANLMTKLNVLQSVRFIRETLPDSKIILGGPDVRYNAKNYLEAGADFIVLGEGEATMLELVQTIYAHSGKSLSRETLDKIRSIAFLQEGDVIETPERDKIKDLDQLPIPNRKKIDLHLYLDAWKKFHGSNAISVSTMRGCPYTCKWCSRAVYGLNYRRRSPEKVVQELEQIKNTYNPDALWFVDDVFTISHKWLTDFLDELHKKNIIIQ